jgi:hypothetical protein
MIRFLAVFVCAAVLPAQPTSRRNVAGLLGFEHVQNGVPTGWGAYPAEHVASDDRVFHGCQHSVRIERQPGSAQDFSDVTLSLPVEAGAVVAWNSTAKHTSLTFGFLRMAPHWSADTQRNPRCLNQTDHRRSEARACSGRH